MFVLRARLTIEKADDIDALAIFGNDAPAMMSRYALPVPEVPLQCIDDPRGLRVVRRLGSVTRYSVIGPRERIAALRTTLDDRSEEHTSELQSLMRISYAVFCLKKKKLKLKNH